MTPYRERLHAGEYAPDEPPENLLPEPAAPAQTEDVAGDETATVTELPKPAERGSK